MVKAEEEGLEKKFRLATTMSTSNMVCFDEEGRIKKYNDVSEILEDFYHLRLIYYQKRKVCLWAGGAPGASLDFHVIYLKSSARRNT